MNKFIGIILTTLLALAAPMLHADILQECNKIVVAGDAEWPPYTIVESSSIDKENHVDLDLVGIGMDLAGKIINELDIPVQQYIYADLTQLYTALRNGDVDLVVSAYDNEAMANNALLLKPAYFIDPITVAVRKDFSGPLNNWESLVGLPGIMDGNFVPDTATQEYFRDYLQITSKGYLIDALVGVKDGKYKYVAGSDLQLSYAIKHSSLNQDLMVMKNISRGGEIFMAFSKNSVCQPYAYYIRKRLQDYKNFEEVAKLVRRYQALP